MDIKKSVPAWHTRAAMPLSGGASAYVEMTWYSAYK